MGPIEAYFNMWSVFGYLEKQQSKTEASKICGNALYELSLLIDKTYSLHYNDKAAIIGAASLRAEKHFKPTGIVL